jgi:phage terminase Nu1 subunit (DNA packaging protein)
MHHTLTRREIAEIFRVEIRTVLNWARRGDIPRPIKIGQRWYWDGEFFEPWLNRNEAKATDQTNG